MPPGDANRTWFPELVEKLRSRWSEAMSMEQLIELTGALDEMLQAVRNQRNIQPSMMWCSKCQTRHRSAPPRVSVRALILALGRFEIATADAVKTLEKRWRQYRKDGGLDPYGSVPMPDAVNYHG